MMRTTSRGIAAFENAILPKSIVCVCWFSLCLGNALAQTTGCASPLGQPSPSAVNTATEAKRLEGTSAVSTDIAAQKAAFQQQMAQLDSDPATQTQIAKARADFAAALASPELASQRANFQQQMAQLQSDPAVQAEVAKARRQFTAVLNSPELQEKQAAMSKDLRAVQDSADFQQQRAQFQNPCQAK